MTPLILPIVLLLATALGSLPETSQLPKPEALEATNASSFSKAGSAVPADCRANIARVTCALPGAGGMITHECRGDNTPYVHYFEAVYDHFPVVLQQMFCSLGIIRVENFNGGFAASGVTGDTAFVAFDKQIIDAGYDLSTLLSFHQQAFFGASREPFVVDEALPRVEVRSRSDPAIDAGFYILAHEFGHLLDVANGLSTPCPLGEECSATPGTFTALSWETSSRTKAKFIFPHQQLYPYESIPKLYEDFYNTDFVSFYAAMGMLEDFAESLAYYLMAKRGDFAFTLETRQGASYDMLARIHSRQFAEKYSYIQRFLARSSITYP